jgi:hypothetical protein
MLSKPTNSIDFTDTRLRTNGCALSCQRISRHAPLFPYQNSSINKGIRAQRLVFRRVLIMTILFDILLNLYTKMEN